IPWVLVPPYPGVTSAMGLLMSDVKHDYVRSRLQPLSETDPNDAERLFGELAAQARADLRAEGFADDQIVLQRLLDLRYAGQGYELSVPAPESPLDRPALAAARQHFDALHERLHGHQAPGEPVEIVNYRLIALARVPRIELRRQTAGSDDATAARKGERRAVFLDQADAVSCPVYDRTRLAPGHRLRGPAIVEQVDSTTVVYPGQEVLVDEYRNLIVRVRGG